MKENRPIPEETITNLVDSHEVPLFVIVCICIYILSLYEYSRYTRSNWLKFFVFIVEYHEYHEFQECQLNPIYNITNSRMSTQSSISTSNPCFISHHHFPLSGHTASSWPDETKENEGGTSKKGNLMTMTFISVHTFSEINITLISTVEWW